MFGFKPRTFKSGNSSTPSINQGILGNLDPQLYLNLEGFNGESTIKDFKNDKLQRISNSLQKIQLQPSSVVRFYDGTSKGLQSLAEEKGQYNLPSRVKGFFTNAHTGSNKKVIDVEGTQYYSPYISTTKNLRDFIDTTFSPEGDTNLRHDVLHRSPVIGTFDNIPPHYLHDMSAMQDSFALPYREKEVLFDSDNPNRETLSSYQSEPSKNPFQGNINIDLNKLFASRGMLDGNSLQRVNRYNDTMSNIPRDTRLNANQLKNFQEAQNLYKTLEQEGFSRNPPIPAPQRYDSNFQPIKSHTNEEFKQSRLFADGGYVSGNSSYDPYLNTYNYPEPLRLSEYLTDQMPESGYDETGGYDDPYMSYGNAYDTDGQQYSFREGGAVERGNSNFPRLLDVIGEEEPVRGDIVNKAKELSQMVINEVLNANNGKLDEPTLINKFTEIGNSLNLNETEKNQVERFVENIFKNSQFNDGPGYFYEKAHGMTNNKPIQSAFKRGGSVGDEDLPKLADLIRRHGRNGDTELAHINPIEAHILKSLGGSGTINPETGLREYSFWKKPWKAIRSVIGGGAGALLGNMILPGAGGIIGGAIGQGAQNAIRGKSALGGALKGAGMGAALPSMASGLGWGASKLGATALGSSLSNYGTTNAILPALGLGGSGSSSGLFGLGGSNPYVNGGLSAATALSSGMGTGRGQGLGVSSGDYAENYYNYMLDRQKKQDNMGFTDKLQDYLTQPGNLLTLGTTAAQYLGREKPKSPEKIAAEERRYRNASRKTIAEVEADEALETARADLQKKHKNKQLEEDIKNMGSTRRRVVSPEEFARTGRWLEYEDDEGRPVRMKSGGLMRSPYDYLVEEVRYPASPLHYLSGDSGGQDDLIDAKLSDGEYVIDAATVADLGDGNNAAGARKLDNFRRNIREHKRGGKITLPPRAKSLQSYLMG
jgi:hypothetical protein